MKIISVIVPCYNEEDVLELFDIEMSKMDFEYQLVSFEESLHRVAESLNNAS